VEISSIERTLNNLCSQSLARKRYITLPRQKSSKIEGSGPPLKKCFRELLLGPSRTYAPALRSGKVSWILGQLEGSFLIFLTLGSIRPRMEKSHSCWPRTVWYAVNMFHKNGMRPLIISNGTKCYSILYCNSTRLYIRLKYTYSVISVELNWLPGNSKKWTIDQFVAFEVRLVPSWAENKATLGSRVLTTRFVSDWRVFYTQASKKERMWDTSCVRSCCNWRASCVGQKK